MGNLLKILPCFNEEGKFFPLTRAEAVQTKRGTTVDEEIDEINNSLGNLIKHESVEIFAQALSYQQSLIITKTYEPPTGYEVFGTELENSEASITVSGINYEEANKRIALKYGCWFTGGSVGHNIVVKVLLVKKY